MKGSRVIGLNPSNKLLIIYMFLCSVPDCFALSMQFLSQPFVVGDRVEILTSSGGRVITGTVERVDPMRTIMRSDAELPITMPNKVQFCLILPRCTGCILFV